MLHCSRNVGKCSIIYAWFFYLRSGRIGAKNWLLCLYTYTMFSCAVNHFQLHWPWSKSSANDSPEYGIHSYFSVLVFGFSANRRAPDVRRAFFCVFHSCPWHVYFYLFSLRRGEWKSLVKNRCSQNEIFSSGFDIK